ncbi:MAG: hypothetical protein GY869_03595 [Planctomycetes bacterium]|nr:hypothetical protein [Planctomycetota bacterium]
MAKGGDLSSGDRGQRMMEKANAVYAAEPKGGYFEFPQYKLTTGVVKIESHYHFGDVTFFRFNELTLYRSPTTDHRSQITDHRLPITDHRQPITDNRPPITDHRSLTTDHRSPTTDHRPPTTDH